MKMGKTKHSQKRGGHVSRQDVKMKAPKRNVTGVRGGVSKMGSRVRVPVVLEKKEKRVIFAIDPRGGGGSS